MAEPIRTIVVDDEEDVRRLLRTRLERDGGFTVVAEAASPADAVALCAEHTPDVVILDAGVPDMEGLAAVPEVRRASPRSVVVIYTSASGLSTRNEAERVGAHAVVGKLDPFDFLTGTIHRLLPEKAPKPDAALQERSEFGQRMTELLEADGDDQSGLPWWRRRGAPRVGFIALLVLVVLPLLAALVWVVAVVAGQLF